MKVLLRFLFRILSRIPRQLPQTLFHRFQLLSHRLQTLTNGIQVLSRRLLPALKLLRFCQNLFGILTVLLAALLFLLCMFIHSILQLFFRISELLQYALLCLLHPGLYFALSI